MVDRRGAANLGIPLMLGALVMLGGFFYWLATTAEPTPPPVVKERSENEATSVPAAVTLNVDSLSLNGPPFYGQRVAIRNASVGQELGEGAFLVQSQQPFVAWFAPDLIAAGQGIPRGSFTLVGVLEPRTDSILSLWLENGTVTPANEVLAEFTTEYVLVERIIPEEGGSGNGGGEGSANDAGDGGAE